MSRRNLAALIALVFLGAAVRLAGLGAPSLWLDEAHSARVALQGWPDLLALAQSYFGGLLYFAQLHLWTGALGSSEFVLRLPSALASLLAIPLLYQLARRIAGERRGLLAALLLALSPLDVWYAQEARMYAQATLLGLLCAYAYLRHRQTGRLAYALVYALAGLAGLYTLYSFPVVLFAITAHWLATGRVSKAQDERLAAPPWPIWLGAHALMIAGFAPWWPVLRGHLHLLAGDVGRWQALASLMRLLEGAGLRGAALGALVVALLAAVGVAGVLLLRRGRGWLAGARRLAARPWAGWLGGLAPYLALAVAAGWRPISSIRQATILMPFVCLAAALALLRWRRGATLMLAMLLVVAVAALGHARARVEKEQWREAAQWIAAGERAGDAILLHAYYTEPAFAYYYAGGVPVGRVAQPGNAARLAQTVGRYERVWLVLSHDLYEDPQRLAERWFDAQASLVEERALAGIRVRLYRMR